MDRGAFFCMIEAHVKVSVFTLLIEWLEELHLILVEVKMLRS